MTRPRLLIVQLGIIVLMAACGGGNSSEDNSSTTEPQVSEPQVTDQEQDTDEQATENDSVNGCPTHPFVGELSRTASSDLGHTAVALADSDLVDAAAFSLGAGVQYTVYLASFEIDDEDVGSTLTAPAGEVLVTFAARGLDGGQIEPGVVYDETFVIIDSGGGAQNHPVDPVGTIEFIAFSDEQICVNIEFLDENQTMSGTVSARVAAGF